LEDRSLSVIWKLIEEFIRLAMRDIHPDAVLVEADVAERGGGSPDRSRTPPSGKCKNTGEYFQY